MDPVVSTKETLGAITMTTSADIIYQRRVRLLEISRRTRQGRLPADGHLADPLLPVARHRQPVRH